MKNQFSFKSLNIVFGTIVCSLLSAAAIHPSSLAAERLSIRVGGAQRAIDVDDLSFFVSTGEIPRSLQWYADRLTEQELAGLRDLLKQPLNVTPRTVSTFVNDTAGEALLRRLNGLFWGGDSRIELQGPTFCIGLSRLR